MRLTIMQWICYAIGYVFIVTGIVKLLNPDFKAVFLSLSLPFPIATLFLVALVEIICGTFIIARLHLRYAVLPLIIIMIGALYITKVPILLNEGLVSFAFASRLDSVMLILLIALSQN